MKVGRYTYGQNNIKHRRLRNGSIQIGSFCSFAENITIYTGKGSHRKEFVSTFPFGFINQDVFTKINCQDLLLKDQGNVIIGDDVWIGGNVVIMPGVSIGSGTIIANNSHVVKSYPPYSIIGGNPAKLIKQRFTDKQVKQLMEIKWWEWDKEKINDNLYLICNENIDKFINVHQK
tara:strand:+ start:3123 stop:3647 length:525 start_codon:yes stop_codon:yes gene_type:complete